LLIRRERHKPLDCGLNRSASRGKLPVESPAHGRSRVVGATLGKIGTEVLEAGNAVLNQLELLTLRLLSRYSWKRLGDGVRQQLHLALKSGDGRLVDDQE